MKNLVISFCVLVLNAFSGCMTIDRDYSYSIVIKNASSSMLADGNVKYGEFESGGGYFSPSARKTHSHPGFPLPEQATVQWRTPDGILHKQNVEVKKAVPVNFKGDIIFEIDDKNQVKVVFEPESQ